MKKSFILQSVTMLIGLSVALSGAADPGDVIVCPPTLKCLNGQCSGDIPRTFYLPAPPTVDGVYSFEYAIGLPYLGSVAGQCVYGYLTPHHLYTVILQSAAVVADTTAPGNQWQRSSGSFMCQPLTTPPSSQLCPFVFPYSLTK